MKPRTLVRGESLFVTILLGIFLFPPKIYAKNIEENLNQQSQEINNLKEEITKKDQYFQLIEKVNQQISYTWNPYIVILTIILIIIGLGTIAVMIIIYYMGKDFRKSASILINKELKERNTKIVEWEKQANAIINKYKKELEEIKKTKGVNKEYYEELIKKLEKLQEDKEKITISSGIGLSNSGLAFGNSSMPCNVCGRPMNYLSVDNVCDSCKNWPGNPPGININGN